MTRKEIKEWANETVRKLFHHKSEVVSVSFDAYIRKSKCSKNTIVFYGEPQYSKQSKRYTSTKGYTVLPKEIEVPWVEEGGSPEVIGLTITRKKK